MDILTPSLEQAPIFGNTIPGNDSLFLKWQYGFYKFLNVIGDVLAVIISQNTWEVIKIIMTVISVFCISVMVYCAVRMFEIRRKEHAHLHEEILEYARHQKEREAERRKMEELSRNPRWVSVINYLNSEDPAQWKMAILEADGMLEDLLEQLGFQGEGLGEKLKSADPEKFRDLTIAWEAHTVRNKIAHEGSTFEISSREAKRIIALYEQIFRTYDFI